MRIGVLFGGSSREREVSFAGGRTVYDNLNKSIFDPIPIFVDSFGNLVLLTWEFIYKGSIRDFYPPAEFLPGSVHEFQVYAESLGDLDRQEQLKLIHKIGSRIEPSALSGMIDLAFLCLHGSDGEDGRIQGLLEFLKVPYTGSGILSSAIGMNKAVQKELMKVAGFHVPDFQVIQRDEWLNGKREEVFRKVKATTGVPCVVKAANQGSSIGVSVLQKEDLQAFTESMNRAFFIRELSRNSWDAMDFREKVNWVREVCDIREGIGLPLMIGSRMFYHPEELLSVMLDLFADQEPELQLVARDGESSVIIESFIQGKEFSCIVVEDEAGQPVALPPTEIRKGRELFDYRSKYLPGLSRKITPIQIPDDQIEAIRSECEKLFTALRFNVYARIDGFITPEGHIILNDPNTTSGMMPSSFFFHQAAEIGMNPSQFITYIIYTSLRNRISDTRQYGKLPQLQQRLGQLVDSGRMTGEKRVRAAVILGGYSSERHISVESGRNIYEKLASSAKYDVLPVFLTGDRNTHELFTIPVNILLKDNADDIREKIDHFSVHPVIERIIARCGNLTRRFASARNLNAPEKISFEELARRCDVVFIALHGRPGEDGSLQMELERVGIPYNGSGPASSKITIDKFRTNEILSAQGLLVARHYLAQEFDWLADPARFLDTICRNFTFPFVAKPADDGCSSAVKIIRNREELEAYVRLAFRSTPDLDVACAEILKIKPKEEFPVKQHILIEDLIQANGAARFIEITGGMLTYKDEQGQLAYEVFEASEALSEGDVLSLEEKFLAGQGQNITPARYSANPDENRLISAIVKKEFEKAARILQIEGYARIDAFVRIFSPARVEVVFIEVNSLPGMTPATCIFHQAAIAHYKPYEFIDKILDFGIKRKQNQPA
ncbi:MAG: D-alanine--D-alanine ligase [Bacteroidia bacterium]|nr:D-alanine--D-alanine ligase [Bacteroidia bacterium]